MNYLISQVFSPQICVHRILLWWYFVCLSFSYVFQEKKSCQKRISEALPPPPITFIFVSSIIIVFFTFTVILEEPLKSHEQ